VTCVSVFTVHGQNANVFTHLLELWELMCLCFLVMRLTNCNNAGLYIYPLNMIWSR